MTFTVIGLYRDGMTFTDHVDASDAKIWFNNGRTSKPALEAASRAQAIRTARAILNVNRVYCGAEYQHEGEFGTALDLWIDKRNATREMGCPADAVVTWR